jgi:hypothetical protein
MLITFTAFHPSGRFPQRRPEAHNTQLTNVPVDAEAPPMADAIQNSNFYDDCLSCLTSMRDVISIREHRRTLKAGRHDFLVCLTEPKGGVLMNLRDYLFFRMRGVHASMFLHRHFRLVRILQSEKKPKPVFCAEQPADCGPQNPCGGLKHYMHQWTVAACDVEQDFPRDPLKVRMEQENNK